MVYCIQLNSTQVIGLKRSVWLLLTNWYLDFLNLAMLLNMLTRFFHILCSIIPIMQVLEARTDICLLAEFPYGIGRLDYDIHCLFASNIPP